MTGARIGPKALIWVGSSRRDLRAFPKAVRETMGFGLYLAQVGGKHPDAKPLAGKGGSRVLEIRETYAGNAYRAVYTVTFPEAVFVVHAFQKKSKRGIATPKKELDIVAARLRQIEENR
ncbi:MAG: type II toxin-antitoxin system RelE/ParE family toxin [SAR324 cluster bacterium]|nr:type II toxin-antitoxin system RelE/ParE family toxin [SAR324 cluster bacterium]